jgi:spermidine/putrescine-binding protein
VDRRGESHAGPAATRLAEYERANRRPIDRAFVRSIFSRDHPGTADPEVVEAFADAILALDDSVPTGTYVDMCARLPVVTRSASRCYQKLRANDTMIVQSHQQVAEMLKRGERPIAAEGLDSYTWEDRKAGHKVETLFPADGAFAIAAPTMVVKGSLHPHAARAFAEFMISDTVQKLFPGDGIYAARSDLEPPPGNPPLSQIRLAPIDYDLVERETKKLKDRFNEIFQ